jgi:hypothetical protein
VSPQTFVSMRTVAMNVIDWAEVSRLRSFMLVGDTKTRTTGSEEIVLQS